MAVSLLENWLLSFWHCTTIPVGIWVILIADSVLFTCCPPAPLALYVSIFKSSVLISISWSLVSSGSTSTEAKDVCLLPLALKGDILTNLCIPFSAFKYP